MSIYAERIVAALAIVIGVGGTAHAGVPTPAPIVGAGLPVLLVAGGAYWLVRRLRNRGD
jgi:lipopolysaccharide export LptBFGC system permease protein LptF